MANSNYWQSREIHIARDVNNAISDVMNKIALQIERELVVTIERSTPTGKEYKRGDYTHIASAPGEPPTTDTGQLVNSIGPTQKETDNSYLIPITCEYAMYLELGTKDMAPRPFVNRSIKNAMDKIPKNIEK